MPEQLLRVREGIDKHQLLTALVPPRARRELEVLRSAGVAAELGDTADRAYDDPLAVRDTFLMLHEYGIQYAREIRWSQPALERIARVASQAPQRRLRRWGRNRLRTAQDRAEQVRGRIMYDRPEVQGQPWHLQNGRATALVTIVDALDLATPDSDGIHEHMSGRLDASLLTLTFGEHAGWLTGLSLGEAIAESAARFRGLEGERVAEVVRKELDELRAFVTAKSGPGFKQIVGYCVDSLGIRSRKNEVRKEIHRHVEETDTRDLLMLSIGCGTALPMLEALGTLRQAGKDGRLILVDQDPTALASAQLIAEQLGLADAIEIHCERLLLGRGRGTKVLDLDTVLRGRQVDVCEDSGLREYFPDFLYRDLAVKAWRATKPGGLIATGNMNTNRPQPEFLSGMMGWPIPVQLRSMRQVHDLHTQAGIPSELLRLRLTQEGVYTLCFVTKPASEMASNRSVSYPLTAAYAAMREAACLAELQDLGMPVARVRHEDPKDDLPAAHPSITREMVLQDVQRTTSEALELIGFDPGSGELPSAESVRELAKSGRLDGVGDVFTKASEIARLWHQKTAYSPLALAPQYGTEDLLPLPELRADGSAPRAHEDDRAFGEFRAVPVDDPARAAWRYHPDTIELRKRGVHLTHKIVAHFNDTSRYPDGARARVAAIAGGAAWPDMQALAVLSQTRPSLRLELDVFDWDKAAVHLGVNTAVELLAAGSGVVARAQTDDARQITTIAAGNVRIRFIHADITNQERLLSCARENGCEGYDIVEAVGLVEYFPEDAASLVIAGMDAVLKDRGGLGIVANMTEYHDHPQILGVIGWQALRPRRLGDVARFVDDGLQLSDPDRVPVKQLELMDEKSYLYVSWRK